jgi:hypothetical protein
MQSCTILTTEATTRIHAALRRLAAADGDHAKERNGVGFSKRDSAFGHSLAACAQLTVRQAVCAARLIVKYRRQIEPQVVAMARALLRAH